LLKPAAKGRQQLTQPHRAGKAAPPGAIGPPLFDGVD